MVHAVHTLDLHFQDMPGTIAAYLIPHDKGAVLVECGPGSTLDALQRGLSDYGFALEEVTDVLLTHIHLDHAGAAGHLAQHGATIHVHHVGAPHLTNPEKLLTSASRIYGDDMDHLWGDFLAVPTDQLVELHDGDTVRVGDLHFDVLETPGHAYHHVAYRFEETCFSGDVAGVRMQGTRHVALPLPPPEINLGLWRESVETLRKTDVARIAPTHFGFFDDVDWHLDAVERSLHEAEAWTRAVLPTDPSDEALRQQVSTWMREQARADGLPPETYQLYETANPSWMAAAGLRRYWRKHAHVEG